MIEKNGEKYWRTLISVEKINKTHYLCEIPAWDARKKGIKMSYDNMPVSLRKKLKAKSYIFGYVNIARLSSASLHVIKYETSIDDHLTDAESEKITKKAKINSRSKAANKEHKRPFVFPVRP